MGYIWRGEEKLRKQGCSKGQPQSWILWKVCWESTFKKIYMVTMIPSTVPWSDLQCTWFSWPSFQVLSPSFMSDTWVISKSPRWSTIKLQPHAHTHGHIDPFKAPSVWWAVCLLLWTLQHQLYWFVWANTIFCKAGTQGRLELLSAPVSCWKSEV